jgi:hypothetical protein
MRKTLLIAVPLFVVLPFISSAQEKGDPNPLDDKYTPGAITATAGGKKGIDNNSQSYLKVGTELFTRNVAAVFYERQFVNGFCVLGGLGYSYYKDMLHEFTRDLTESTITEATSSVSLHRIITNGQFKQGFNPFVSVTIKSLFSSWTVPGNAPANIGDTDGGYIEFGVRYDQQHYELRKVDNFYPERAETIADPPAKVTVRNTYFTTMYGKQWGSGEKIIHQLYSGIGFKLANFNTFTAENTVNQYYTVTKIKHVQSGKRDSTFSPMLLFGYVIGFKL